MSSHGKNHRPKLVTTLPEHLILHQILTRLPIKSLFRFKVVCKSWLRVVSSSTFKKSHLNFCNALNHKSVLIFYRNKELKWEDWEYADVHWEDWEYGDVPLYEIQNSEERKNKFIVFLYDFCSKKDFVEWEEEMLHNYKLCSSNVIGSLKLEVNSEYTVEAPDIISVVGSCNGLVCLLSRGCIRDFAYIWNPVTRQCRQIPISSDVYQRQAVHGFGYASSVDDYILIEFLGGKNYVAANIQFRMFSLKTSSWKNIPCDCLTMFGDQPIWLGSPVFVKNTMYWILDSGGKWYLLRFDLDTQQFLENPWPMTNLRPVFGRNPCLLRWKNRLAFYDKDDKNDFIWTMTKNGDMSSWQKVNALENDPCHCTPKREIYEPVSCLIDRLDKSNQFAQVDELSEEAKERNHTDFQICKQCTFGTGYYVKTLISPFGDD